MKNTVDGDANNKATHFLRCICLQQKREKEERTKDKMCYRNKCAKYRPLWSLPIPITSNKYRPVSSLSSITPQAEGNENSAWLCSEEENYGFLTFG